METKKVACIGYNRFLFPHMHVGLHLSTRAKKEIRYNQYVLLQKYCILYIFEKNIYKII